MVATEDRQVTPLRHLHDTQVSLEKLRIGIGNRVSAIQRGVDENENPVPDVYMRLHGMADQMEAEIDKAILDELGNWRVWNEWLRHVKGIGPSLAGQMLAMLLPPIPSKGPSSWYKAAGLTAYENEAGQMRLERPGSGRGENGKLSYHPWLRRCLFNVATSFVRNGGYYRQVYERGKAQLQERHAGDENWPPHRVDSAARWKMIKLFLSHLWEAWSVAESIPRRPAYVIEKLGHQYIPRPMPEGKGKI